MGALLIAAAGELYSAILDDIEAHDYDVFGRRAHVGAWDKLRRLPGIWWNNRRGTRPCLTTTSLSSARVQQDLSLAYCLLQSPLRDRSILIVDRDAKNRNDRTWCYWTAQPTLFAPIVHRSWDRIQFVGEDFASTIDLERLSLRDDSRDRFLPHLPGMLCRASGNVDFVQGTSIGSTMATTGRMCRSASVATAGGGSSIAASGLADLTAGMVATMCSTSISAGWEIETSEPVFDLGGDTARFSHPPAPVDALLLCAAVLEQHALVEYVSLCPDEAAQALRALSRHDPRIDRLSHPGRGARHQSADRSAVPAPPGRHIMAIGAHGGRIKPTSGYAFMRIQHDSAAIVRSLLRLDQPFDVPRTSGATLCAIRCCSI